MNVSGSSTDRMVLVSSIDDGVVKIKDLTVVTIVSKIEGSGEIVGLLSFKMTGIEVVVSVISLNSVIFSSFGVVVSIDTVSMHSYVGQHSSSFFFLTQFLSYKL